jgi:hypothetical protein
MRDRFNRDPAHRRHRLSAELGSSAKLGLNKDFLAPCPGDCITLVTAASFWPERKISGSNLNSFLAPILHIHRKLSFGAKRVKFEPEIFLSGQKLAAVTKGIQSPGYGARKALFNPSLVV